MKRIIIAVIAASAFLVSCQKSNEEKAEELIKVSMNKTLLHPESYEAVETVLDSAFAPLDSPEFFNKIMKVVHCVDDMSKVGEEINEAQTSMSLWSICSTALARNEYRKAKAKYEAACAKKEELEKKSMRLAEKLKPDLQNKPTFIGFKARHKYRANTNAGNTVFGEMKFVFDKELTKVIAEYDMQDEEYVAYQKLLEIMNGEE